MTSKYIKKYLQMCQLLWDLISAVVFVIFIFIIIIIIIIIILFEC